LFLFAGAASGSTVAGSSTDPGPYAYQFSSPTGITFDPFGYMYVLDAGNSRIQRWLPGGSYGITVVATSMSTPYGLQVDARGNLIVTDTSNHRVISFAITCRKYS
jgi:sugar lactone lactonase YvrE